MPAEEKTESATPKKRQEVRRRGQVAKSADLSSILVFLGIVMTIHVAGSSMSNRLLTYMTNSLSATHQQIPDSLIIQKEGAHIFLLLFQIVGPVFIAGLLIGIMVNLVQTNFLFSSQALAPNFNRLNPLEGAKRFLSTKGLFETIKATLKLYIIGYIAWSSVSSSYPQILSTMRDDIPTILGFMGDLIYHIALRIGLFLFVLSAADYGYQKYSFEKSIRMTKEEVKQEMKQSEGNPKVRARIRARMRQLARKRMMQDVPKADVVVTNPTHFAVALQYKSSSMRAPKVLAKGSDLIAQRIREIAESNNVPIVENPPLARTLWRNVEIGQEIPSDLYSAVAEVLAYVYKLNKKHSPIRT